MPCSFLVLKHAHFESAEARNQFCLSEMEILNFWASMLEFRIFNISSVYQ